ncbi:MAG TPA: bifunctional salicylyl-CoA 5-hydroxylase/oxidoreductase [Gemmatimonadales bacterium]|nr:bifunctional salicylyl-CoA 5-hydroxylase/oxidoreductase [Gemmatimonadales bacterium]
MRIVAIGGGPAALYFGILMKEADPAHEITILERNRLDDSFGFGVVFSDATQNNLAAADPETYASLAHEFFHWDDISIHQRPGHVIRSGGHGFSGLSRHKLLQNLGQRCRALGVCIEVGKEVTDPEVYRRDADLVLGADGFNSIVRQRYAEHFKPSMDERPNRFVWLGTTRPFPAFTFYFKRDKHGLWRVHAYQYEQGHSTFIVEATEATWRSADLDRATEGETVAFCEKLFEKELEGHPLLKNRSLWRNFVTIKNANWSHENVVLVGDAAHTAHFSVGSGTKLAIEDAIALSGALRRERDVPAALAAYETERRPAVESLQRAAQVSLQWFEDTERYMNLEPLQFAFNLLTRSLRITHDNLKVRDPQFVESVDQWFEQEAEKQSHVRRTTHDARPPMFTPFKLRDMLLSNRVVVSPMCQYVAEDGMPNEWHLVHIGSRAIGGAGLVFVEMTDVSQEARISPGCAGMYKLEHAKAWKRIVEFVHTNSSSKIAVQLGHAGRKASTRRMWEGMDEPLAEGNWPIISASPLPYFPHSQVPKEMTRADMDQVKADFVRAAELSNEADFDLLELHFAHGYLMASFISPLTNQRTDQYGGSLENRMRFPLDVFDAVRKVWPAHKPMSVRISAVDWHPAGTKPVDAVDIARLLKAHDCDITDVSAGQTIADAKPQYGRQFQTPFADRIRHEVGIATMAVGNISSYQDVNTILAAGRADLCVLARAHLWDPYWTRHAAYEQGYAFPWPDPYATLNKYKPRPA